MNYNPKFALIDKVGDARYAAIIDGTYQIGKDSRRKPSTIEDFARAILLNGDDGRFVCADGRKPAVLKYISTRKLEAVGYKLDPAIAARLGIAAYGKK